MRVQVIDLGCAKQLQAGERTFTLCGTMDYLCPEIILMQGHGAEADLWQVRIITCIDALALVLAFALTCGRCTAAAGSVHLRADCRQAAFRRIGRYERVRQEDNRRQASFSARGEQQS